jgi:hypothetical protein
MALRGCFLAGTVKLMVCPPASSMNFCRALYAKRAVRRLLYKSEVLFRPLAVF